MEGRNWQAVAWGVAAVVAVLLALQLLGSPAAPPAVKVAGADAAPGGSSPRASRDGPYVHVAGAVRRPGLYRLGAGARVAAAVRRAGGAAGDADLTAINLAAPLQDGQQVLVPVLGPDGVPAAARAAAAEGPIGLGAATAEQLEGIDGIGPTLAQRIVDHRQAVGGFSSLDQLGEVDGIGEGRLATLKQALTP